MSKGMSKREKIVVVIVGILSLFVIYWFLFLGPSINLINKTEREIQKISEDLNKEDSDSGINTASHKGGTITLYRREAQIGRIVKLIEMNLGKSGLKMVSFRQNAQNNRLTIDVVCKGDYLGLVSFLDSLKDTDTFIMLDSLKMVSEKNDLTVSLRMVSGYL